MRCVYCDSIFSNPPLDEPAIHNHILLESEHFVAIPTIGALVEGWLLIVTKQHRICMACLDEKTLDELDRFKSRVSRTVAAHYGPTTVFEHGPARPNQAVGCGVDHAHLHIVPTECDLIAGLHTVLDDDVKWQHIRGIRDLATRHALGYEYLYVEQYPGHAHVVFGQNLGSQLFRKVLANHVGRPDEFDWKTHAGMTNVTRTVQTLRSALSAQTTPNMKAECFL